MEKKETGKEREGQTMRETETEKRGGERGRNVGVCGGGDIERQREREIAGDREREGGERERERESGERGWRERERVGRQRQRGVERQSK